MAARRFVLIGAGQCAMAAAGALRARGFDGELITKQTLSLPRRAPDGALHSPGEPAPVIARCALWMRSCGR
jgi:hypothetical protein